LGGLISLSDRRLRLGVAAGRKAVAARRKEEAQAA
jgi:hypothetical protein